MLRTVEIPMVFLSLLFLLITTVCSPIDCLSHHILKLDSSLSNLRSLAATRTELNEPIPELNDVSAASLAVIATETAVSSVVHDARFEI